MAVASNLCPKDEVQIFLSIFLVLLCVAICAIAAYYVDEYAPRWRWLPLTLMPITVVIFAVHFAPLVSALDQCRE